MVTNFLQNAGVSSYRYNPSVVVTDLEDELVLLDPTSKQMFSLNTVGRVLWLELPHAGLDATLERIISLFDVPPAVAHADVLTLIEHLSANNLLEVSATNV